MLHQYEQTVALPPLEPQERNQSTLDILLTSERAWLVRLCALIVRNADAAEDLAQETLLEAWRNQQKLRDQGSEQQDERRRWLTAIARNICLRWLREYNHERAYRILQQNGNESNKDVAGQGQDEWSIERITAPDRYGVEIEFERAELSTLLNKALTHLSEPLRTALVARYIQGATHDEIIQQLQVNEATLVQRIYRGKRALRTVLVTHLKHELATYGIHQMGTEPGELVTRMWCPWCGDDHIILKENAETGGLLFRCRSCNTPVAGKSQPGNWQKISSSVAKHALLIKWFHTYYWQAIDQKPTCIKCGASAVLSVKEAQDLPAKYHGLGDQPGIAIFCNQCQSTHYNTLSHLTFDLPQVANFWRTHKRICWQQGEQIEHAGIPAWISTFHSKDSHEQIDILIERQTFHVLAINEYQ